MIKLGSLKNAGKMECEFKRTVIRYSSEKKSMMPTFQ